MRGYLYKFRDREISFASKWSLRYFLLQGNTLSYFLDDSELRPRRTINLTGCIVREEGTKKNGLYHCFSISWFPDEGSVDEDDNNSDGTDNGSVLFRLSSTKRAEALQWVRVLEDACRITAEESPELSSKVHSLTE